MPLQIGVEIPAFSMNLSFPSRGVRQEPKKKKKREKGEKKTHHLLIGFCFPRLHFVDILYIYKKEIYIALANVVLLLQQLAPVCLANSIFGGGGEKNRLFRK